MSVLDAFAKRRRFAQFPDLVPNEQLIANSILEGYFRKLYPVQKNPVQVTLIETLKTN